MAASPPRHRQGRMRPWPWQVLLLAASLLSSSTQAAVPPPAFDPLQHHALEDRALVEPEAVLAELPARIEQARAAKDQRELALLFLAQANACRVIANWTCQDTAGADARDAAEIAGEPLLAVRGLIAESRASIAQQDYTHGERLLARAEALLRTTPSPELFSDVQLAYSSLSFALGKHAAALDYANRGLLVLKNGVALPMQVRLLRNRARSQALLGDVLSARGSLNVAQRLVESLNDPKLSAELSLESARLARTSGDVETQRQSGRAILALSEKLKNSQLAGLGHEVMGLAALDAGDKAAAESNLRTAYEAFRQLGLDRDELRVSREDIRLMLERGASGAELTPRVTRYLDLATKIEKGDRAQASDDFDARLKYLQREYEVDRLEAEARAAAERERLLAQTNRLTRWLVVLSLAIVLVLGAFYLFQRRAYARLRSAMDALRHSDARAEDLLRLSSGYVFLHDLEGRLMLVNPASAEALGYAPEDIVGRSLAEFMSASTSTTFGGYLHRVRKQGQDEGVILIRTRDGSERHWRYSNRLSSPQDSRAYVVGNAVDVTEQVLQAEKLRDQNERDALTGVYNRRFLDSFERRHPAAGRWAAVTVDLDHFKHINDTEGHERGDQVLIEIGGLLQDKVRADDAVVRLGGDEFVVLLGDADAATLEKLVERLRQDADKAPCRFSLGAALREGDESLAATMARADAAMYSARSVARRTTTP